MPQNDKAGDEAARTNLIKALVIFGTLAIWGITAIAALIVWLIVSRR